MSFCFVIMPYTVKSHVADRYRPGHWDEVFEKLIMPAAERVGLECKREDKTRATTLILHDITESIERARLVLCDLSTNNPNVLLELGWAIRAGKPVVLIRDECTDPTFDLSQVTTLHYSHSLERADLAAAVQMLADSIAATLRGRPILHSLPGHADLGGIQEFRRSRSELGPDWWEQFYSVEKNPKNVLMMGQSISKAFTNERQASAFVKWCTQGAAMRVLLLSPENTEALQLQSVGSGISVRAGVSRADPSEYLKDKIYDTIESLRRNVTARVSVWANKPMVRFAARDMPFSIMAVDGDMVVTFYGTDPEADNQPTLLIKGEESAAYQAYKAEFGRIWGEYSKVVPYEDPLLVPYRRQWREHIGLRNRAVHLGPPMQAIIYPTYRCSANCPYCMYRTERTGDPPAEMAPEDLDRILRQLFDFGVRHFEISGGGEPLEHNAATEVLACIQQFVESNSGTRVGLLTNGMRLPNHGAGLLDVFNDYIRVSRYEALRTEDQESAWRGAIKELLVAKRKRQSFETRIGLKYLLAPENEEGFVSMVREDFKDRELLNVDHLRFRSDRRMHPEVITRIEQHVYYLLEEAGLITMSDRVSLSLSNIVYPRNFRCWISPLHVVIAPDQDVYVCCNYTRRRDDKFLGNLAQTPFAALWNSPRHEHVRQRLTRAHCDWPSYCNCRYAEIQGMFERIAFAVGTERLEGAVSRETDGSR